MVRSALVAIAFVAAARLVRADVYMINPRGSNNRYVTQNQNQVDVQNANRLFDSENNADGGHDLPLPNEPFKYYVGSYLTIEWASQHACGKDSPANCEIVLQYMCGPDVRDGTNNNRIQFNAQDRAATEDAVSEGMHESWYNYHSCTHRSRNRGLFTADQKLNGDSAKVTRQQPNEDRFGLECPEERDYYPYWAPSPWKDIAVLTNDVSRCELYWNTTQNTNSRYQCVDQEKRYGANFRAVEFIKEQQCQSAQRTGSTDKKQYTWQEFKPHFHDRRAVQSLSTTDFNQNVPFYGAGDKNTREECERFARDPRLTKEQAEQKCLGILGGPLCRENVWQRDNHLGTVLGGHFANFTWRIPDDANPNDRCVLRMRYNISTDDYSGWTADATQNGGKNTGISPVEQDPYVEWNWIYPIELALNTNQYGRTFQDRSHTFRIMPRPSEISDDHAIWNVNVRGRRGHISQTFPVPTYDFTPRDLHVKSGDYVHWQWGGGSVWPPAFVGQGRSRTDRHNVVQIKDMKSNFPMPLDEVTMFSKEEAIKFAMVGQENLDDTMCDDQAKLRDDVDYFDNLPYQTRYEKLKRVHNADHHCGLLNEAEATFFHEPVQFLNKGAYYYMCTRNNVPGWASQKGAVYVE